MIKVLYFFKDIKKQPPTKENTPPPKELSPVHHSTTSRLTKSKYRPEGTTSTDTSKSSPVRRGTTKIPSLSKIPTPSSKSKISKQ